MKINQRFRSRKDLTCWVVYFEGEGPLEMSEISAFIVRQLSDEKSREELLAAMQIDFPLIDAEKEIEQVITVLSQLNLLS